MSMSKTYYCDFCGTHNAGNHYPDTIYGIQSANRSESSEWEITKKPTEDDNIHICDGCIKELSKLFSNMK